MSYPLSSVGGVARVLTLGLLAVVGCESDNDDSTRADSSAEQAAVDSQSTDAGVGTVGAFSAWIEPSLANVCAGECTTLSARVHGTLTTPKFVWNEGLSDAATQKVCPQKTTTYRVDIGESATASAEFSGGGQSASAMQTIIVRDDCGAAPSKPAAAKSACSYRIPLEPVGDGPLRSLYGGTAEDGAGNLYYVGSLDGKARIGDAEIVGGHGPTVVDPDGPDVLLLKLSPTCELVWFRLLKARFLGAFAVHESGEIALLTTDVRQQFVWDTRSYRNHLAKLTTSGEVSWEVFEPEVTAGAVSYVEDALSYAPDGTLVTSHMPSLCPDAQRDDGCIAAIDKNGTRRWSFQLRAIGAGYAHDPQGNLIVSGMAGPHGLMFAGQSLTDGVDGPSSFVAVVNPEGAVSWVRNTAISLETVSSAEHRARRTRDGNVMTTWLEPNTQTGQSAVTWRLGSDGKTLALVTNPLPQPLEVNPYLQVLPGGDLLATAGIFDPQFPQDYSRLRTLMMRLSYDYKILTQRDLTQLASSGMDEDTTRGTAILQRHESDPVGYQVALVLQRVGVP